MDEIVGYVMLVLLGLLVATLIGGMFAGMIRGPKRTAKRLVVLLGFFIIALLITPLVSSALVNSTIGRSLKDSLLGMIEEPMVDSALNSMGDVAAFAFNLPVAIINIFVFWLLLVLFRYVLSPIFSVLLLKKIAPAKDADGNKIPYSKMAGLGMGVLQGLVVFMFFAIPLTGLMSSLNKIDSYQPELGNFNVLDTGIEVFDELNGGIRDLNSSVQESPFGVISKYSGMQLLGDFGLGYFSNVKAGKTTVNLKNDVEDYFELTRDFAAVYQLVNGLKDGKQLIEIFSNDANVKYMESVINKAFKIGTIVIALNSEVGEFASEADLLGDINLDGIVDDQSAYNQSIYKGIGNLNANFIKEDLLSALELARLVFAEHPVEGTTARYSLYRDIDNLLFVLNNEFTVARPLSVGGSPMFNNQMDALQYVLGNLDNTLSNAKFGTGPEKRNLAQQIFHVFGNMNIFKSLLLDESNPELYSMPLGKLLGMNPADAVIKDFDQMMDGAANIVIRIVRVGPTFYKLMNTTDVVEWAEILGEDASAVGAIGEILEILTNRGDENGMYNGNKVMGTGNILRKFISDTIKSQFGEEDGSAVGFDKLFETLIADLAVDGPEIAWSERLDTLRKLVIEVSDVFSGDFDTDEFINKILKGDALDLIAEDEWLSDIIVSVLDDAINGAIGDTGITVNFSGEGVDSGDVIKALGALVDATGDIASLLDDVSGDGNFDNVNKIVELFGGAGGEDSAIVMLAKSGVTISGTGVTESDLETYLGGFGQDAPIQNIYLLFGFEKPI